MTSAERAARSESKPGLMNRLRARRREFVFKAGKRLRKPLKRFLARQSKVGDPEIFEPHQFPWLQQVEDAADVIRRELQSILCHRERLPLFQDISRDNSKIALGEQWKVFMLLGMGIKARRNCEMCPETMRVLEKVPGIRTAWFSILAPRAHVPAHKGITKGLLRCHLGLVIPRDAENCRMQVGRESFHWVDGKAVVFDDARKHEVWNDTDEERVVLLFDFDRPMGIPGRCLTRAFLRLLTLSGYFRDAVKAQRDWEEKFHRAVAQSRLSEAR